MLQVNNEYNELVRLAHDRRVKKVVVFDTETTPYYETVEPYWINGCSVIPCKENGIYNVLQYEPYVHGNKAYYKYLTDKKCKQIVFDFGYTIATKKGVILEKRNFLVREVFMDMALMKNAYYFEKYPLYLDMLQNGSIEMKSWNEIVSILYKDFTEYNMHEAYAYNIAFDLGALHNTNHYVNQKPFLLWKMLDVKLTVCGAWLAKHCSNKKHSRKLLLNRVGLPQPVIYQRVQKLVTNILLNVMALKKVIRH